MGSALPGAAPRLLRDQQRAAIAYQCVAEAVEGGPEAAERSSDASKRSTDASKRSTDARAYKNLVLAIGVDIRRMGLSAALAAVERGDAVGERLLGDLRRAPMHICPPEDQDLPTWVRGLGLTAYMVVTRELLQFVVWLRRAVQSPSMEL